MPRGVGDRDAMGWIVVALFAVIVLATLLAAVAST
jgi:hypothetical protein